MVYLPVDAQGVSSDEGKYRTAKDCEIYNECKFSRLKKMHHLIVSSYWVVSLICKVFGIGANFRKLKNVTCMDVDGMIIGQS